MLVEAAMAGAAERIATLEGRVQEHSQTMSSMQASILHGEQRLDARFSQFESRIESRFDAVERRFERVDARLDRLEDRMSRQFVWTIGILISMFATIVGGFAARL